MFDLHQVDNGHQEEEMDIRRKRLPTAEKATDKIINDSITINYAMYVSKLHLYHY